MNDPAIQACDDFIREKRIDTTKNGWRTGVQKPPKLPFDGARSYFWKSIEANPRDFRPWMALALMAFGASDLAPLRSLRDKLVRTR